MILCLKSGKAGLGSPWSLALAGAVAASAWWQPALGRAAESKGRGPDPAPRGAAVPAVSAAPASAAPAGRPVLVTGRAGYLYLCLLPRPWPKPPERPPMLVFLHGTCPDEDLGKFKRFGPVSFGLTRTNSPFVVICPASARPWTTAGVFTLIEHAVRAYRTDPNRIYLTGYSAGGHLTWMLALERPYHFAAIAPVAGAGNAQAAQARLRDLPIWIFHGARDKVVDAKYARAMSEALEAVGAEVRLTVYPNRGHDVWNLPYADPALYDWFLQHRRKDPPSGL